MTSDSNCGPWSECSRLGSENLQKIHPLVSCLLWLLLVGDWVDHQNIGVLSGSGPNMSMATSSKGALTDTETRAAFGLGVGICELHKLHTSGTTYAHHYSVPASRNIPFSLFCAQMSTECSCSSRKISERKAVGTTSLSHSSLPVNEGNLQ